MKSKISLGLFQQKSYKQSDKFVVIISRLLIAQMVGLYANSRCDALQYIFDCFPLND